jgi:hypothetical protein
VVRIDQVFQPFPACVLQSIQNFREREQLARNNEDYMKSRDAESVAKQEQMSKSVGTLIKTTLRVEERECRICSIHREPFRFRFSLISTEAGLRVLCVQEGDATGQRPGSIQNQEEAYEALSIRTTGLSGHARARHQLLR